MQSHRRQPTRLPVPGILQARTLEWVAISFYKSWKWKVKVKLLSCVWLSEPMDCSLPGSSIHGILQARVLEWGAIAFSMNPTKASVYKESVCQCRRHKRCGFNPWVGKIPWVGNGNPFQYSCLENHGQRSLMGYSPWGRKELDMTEHTTPPPQWLALMPLGHLYVFFGEMSV